MCFDGERADQLVPAFVDRFNARNRISVGTSVFYMLPQTCAIVFGRDDVRRPECVSARLRVML